MSILSTRPDGFGYYYGFVRGDHRQINVRREGTCWVALVGGECVGAPFSSKEIAEAAAIAYIEANPEPSGDDD